MIYKLRADRQKYLNFYIDAYVIEKIIGDFFLLHQERWVDFWKPVPVAFADDSDSKNVVLPPDITVWATENCLALNQKAYDALKSHLDPFGEFLPLKPDGNPYWLFHSTRKTDLTHVDSDRSIRSVDEVDFVEMQSLVFNERSLKGELVFQTEFSGYKNMYCTEEFKSLIDHYQLAGLIFSTDLACVHEP